VVRAQAQFFGEALFDCVGDGQDLALGGAVAQEEVVGEVAQVAKVEDDDVLGLLVARSLDAGGEFGLQRRASSRYNLRS
jgi:hypothetical protein